MTKFIMEGKNYKVSGEFLVLISELISMYREPYIIYNKDKVEYIPIQKEYRDFLIGQIAQMFDETDWEEE